MSYFSSSHAHDDADADNESDCEAASHGTMLDEDWYHVMPPPTTRHNKRRSMEKAKQSRHRTDSKGSAEKARPVGHRAHGQSSPSRGRCSNAVTCSVSDGTHHVTVDAPVDTNHSREPSPFSAKKRKDSMKNFTTIRAYERDLKSSSSDLAAMDSPVQVQTMSVDTPDRFMCLNPRLVPPVAGNNKCDMSSQKPTAPPECPRDRIMFYKTFLMLINLGNSARKEKESKIGPYTRQLSCEQEVWQNEVNDLIWLELQAWYSGRTLRLQDEFLCEEREKVPAVLDEVVSFKVMLTGCTDTASCGENSDNDGISVVCGDGALIVTDASPDAEPRISELLRASDVDATSQLERCLDGCVWECAHALAETTAAQKEALIQVSGLLDDLGTVEHLYPTTKALGKEYPLYDTAEFRLRVDTLCLWMNVVKDLGHKLQLMAKVLRVDKIDGLQWPWLDGATLCDAVDNATVDDTESDMSVTSYSTPDSVKNVRFNLSEASLTDIAANEIQAQTSVSSSYRTTSVEDICSAHIYRHFVDRTLKKTGMRKLLMRLIRLTSGTLQRAKEALQKPKTTPSYADVVVQEVSVGLVLSSFFVNRCVCTKLI